MWIFIVYLPNCNLFLVAKTVWGGFFLYNICHTLLSHFEFSEWVKFIFSPWRHRAEAQRLWRLFCVHLSSCVLSKTQDSNPDIACPWVNTKVLRNTLTFLSTVQVFLFSWKKKKEFEMSERSCALPVSSAHFSEAWLILSSVPDPLVPSVYAYLWSLWVSVLSLHCVSPGYWTQVVSLGGKRLYHQLNDLTSSCMSL